MAYFRADLCLSSPESYSLEEKKDICNGMMSTSKATPDAMRADFESMSPELRSKLRTRSTSLVSSRPNGGGACSSAKATRSTETWSR